MHKSANLVAGGATVMISCFCVLFRVCQHCRAGSAALLREQCAGLVEVIVNVTVQMVIDALAEKHPCWPKLTGRSSI